MYATTIYTTLPIASDIALLASSPGPEPFNLRGIAVPVDSGDPGLTSLQRVGTNTSASDETFL